MRQEANTCEPKSHNSGWKRFGPEKNQSTPWLREMSSRKFHAEKAIGEFLDENILSIHPDFAHALKNGARVQRMETESHNSAWKLCGPEKNQSTPWLREMSSRKFYAEKAIGEFQAETLLSNSDSISMRKSRVVAVL